jgi:hypothetical protein
MRLKVRVQRTFLPRGGRRNVSAYKNFLLLFVFIFDIISVEREKVMKEIIFLVIGVVVVIAWLLKD